MGHEIDLTTVINETAHPLRDDDDLDPLMEQIGDKRFVLMGEATHGTSEYYQWRARLTKRLITEKDFDFIAVEGDWPDCYDINRYIKGYQDGTAQQVLETFKRWPTWMWANREIAALMGWLRAYNDVMPQKDQVGFFGLDVYSLWESMDVLMDYLETEMPDALEEARRAYMCFEPYQDDAQEYAWSTMMVPQSCEDEVVNLLVEMRRRLVENPDDAEARLNAEQNAHVMVNAERYYRAMVRSNASSWNLRDQHMMETLQRLADWHGTKSKGIVWEHNTHIGDARATDMARAGMINIGQLAREEYGADEVTLVGFGSHRGSVIAGRQWGAPMEEMDLPAATDGSWEDLMHRAGENDKLMLLDELFDHPLAMQKRGHRAVGVVYKPERESFGNYVPTVLPRRYDAFLFIDETQALHPIRLHPERSGLLDTFPWGV